MTGWTRLVIILVSLWLAPVSANATVYGHGHQSCSTWLESKAVLSRPGEPDALNAALYTGGLSWVQGFYAASAKQFPALRGARYVTPEVLEGLILKPWADNPQFTMNDVAASLVHAVWTYHQQKLKEGRR